MVMLGAICFDEGFGDINAPAIHDAGIMPARVDSGPHSRGGWEYQETVGGSVYSFFTARSGDQIWYYLCVEVTSADSVVAGHTILFSRVNSGTATGAVRLIYEKDGTNPTTQGKFGVQYYDGGTWTVATYGSVRNHGRFYARLRVDTRASPNNTYELFVNGSSDIASTQAGAVQLVATSTPCMENQQIGGKGTSVLTYRLWELAVNDSSGAVHNTAKTYDSSEANLHVYGNYPNADVSGAWTTVNNVAACSGDKWRAVDDPEDSEDQANDKITITGNGTNQDQLFEATDQSDASADIYGVGILISSGSSSGATRPDAILAHCPSEGGSPTAYTGTVFGNGVHAGRYVFLNTTPGGNAWTKAKYNELRVGVRNSSASTVQDCFLVCVSTPGVNQAKPADAAACPVATRRPAQVVLGSASPSVY